MISKTNCVHLNGAGARSEYSNVVRCEVGALSDKHMLVEYFNKFSKPVMVQNFILTESFVNIESEMSLVSTVKITDVWEFPKEDLYTNSVMSVPRVVKNSKSFYEEGLLVAQRLVTLCDKVGQYVRKIYANVKIAAGCDAENVWLSCYSIANSFAGDLLAYSYSITYTPSNDELKIVCGFDGSMYTIDLVVAGNTLETICISQDLTDLSKIKNTFEQSIDKMAQDWLEQQQNP